MIATDIDQLAIALSDENTVKGMPWEELATAIPPGASVQEVLEIAGLDWLVEKIQLEVNFRDEYKKVDGNFALLRDNGEILSPYMGNRYKPVQNEDAFEVFDQFIRAGDMTMETAGSLHNGKHIWGLASIGEEFILGDGEKISGYFLLMQSHAYGFALKAMFTPIRFPGGHTMIQPLRGVGGSTGIYSMPHSRKFNDERIEEIKNLVTKAKDHFAEFQEKAKFLADTKFTEADAILYLAQLFDKKMINRCKEDKIALPQSFEELNGFALANRTIKKAAGIARDYPGHDLDSCDGTAWGYYNGVIHALDHVMGHKPDTRLESSWIGKNAGVKLNALDMSAVIAASK